MERRNIQREGRRQREDKKIERRQWVEEEEEAERQ